MVDALVSGMTSSIGVFYGILIPVMLIQLLALVFMPSLLQGNPKPRAVAKAVYGYFMQGFGIVLMSLGALPTVFSVLAGVSYTGGTYIALLLVFAAGGAIFLWQDQNVQRLDAAARAVPEAIFVTVFKIIGTVTLVLAVLSLALNIALGSTVFPGWWVMPLLLTAYGALIAWCTREDVPAKSAPVKSVTSLVPAKAAVKPPVAKKKGK